jgi:hypothetical protein
MNLTHVKPPLDPAVLRPFDRSETLSAKEAAAWSGKTVSTIKRWCYRFAIGRRVGGRWLISKPALLALLEGDGDLLARYWAGDRESAAIAELFERAGAPLPRIRRAA